jgi:hypothetical protein
MPQATRKVPRKQRLCLRTSFVKFRLTHLRELAGILGSRKFCGGDLNSAGYEVVLD